MVTGIELCVRMHTSGISDFFFTSWQLFSILQMLILIIFLVFFTSWSLTYFTDLLFNSAKLKLSYLFKKQIVAWKVSSWKKNWLVKSQLTYDYASIRLCSLLPFLMILWSCRDRRKDKGGKSCISYHGLCPCSLFSLGWQDSSGRTNIKVNGYLDQLLG